MLQTYFSEYHLLV